MIICWLLEEGERRVACEHGIRAGVFALTSGQLVRQRDR